MSNPTFAQRWFTEVWNNGRAELIDEMRAPEASSVGLFQPDAVHSVESFKEEYRRFTSAFSAINIHIDDEITLGDKSAVRWTCTATHTGDGLGIPPTGKTVTFPGASFFYLENGKLREGWNSFDFTRVLDDLRASTQP
jgi:steroid delta-isomerase-like uncharacterized protein